MAFGQDRSIVLVGFAAILWLVIREEVPANQRDMVSLLLGDRDGVERRFLLGRVVERVDAEECRDGEGSYSAVTPCRRRIARCRQRSHRIPSAASRHDRQAGAAR